MNRHNMEVECVVVVVFALFVCMRVRQVGGIGLRNRKTDKQTDR